MAIAGGLLYAILVVAAIIVVILIIKKLIKLAIIVGAVALGVWLGLKLFAGGGG